MDVQMPKGEELEAIEAAAETILMLVNAFLRVGAETQLEMFVAVGPAGQQLWGGWTCVQALMLLSLSGEKKAKFEALLGLLENEQKAAWETSGRKVSNWLTAGLDLIVDDGVRQA